MGFEEPALRREFGTEYEQYRQAVSRWVPRWKPWPGGSTSQMTHT
jgi:protein-S-isoprenylcysteine O-methyltransferase Ste14